MFVQAFLAQPSVETFDHRVIGWLARSTEVNLDFAFIGPAIHRLADEFAAVVRLDRLRRTALACDRVYDAYNVLALQALPYVNGQTLSREAVNQPLRASTLAAPTCCLNEWGHFCCAMP